MSIVEEIDNFIERARKEISQKTIRQKSELYASGLKSKLKQIDYTLEKLAELSSKDDDTFDSTREPILDIYSQVAFFTDTFCVFLYSSLDILAQIVNQVYRFGMDEKQVDFNKISKKLEQNHLNSELQKLFQKIQKSRAFKNLNKYRNCSVHRRQIFMEEKTEKFRRTQGYNVSTSGPVNKTVRVLCDDPYAIKPKTDKKREVPDYLEELERRIISDLEKIIKILSKEL
ncbi:MAG: hypothetical protein K9H48_16485 [Melioribacteraceae bacterium]|nr:hypothetical protein [Saprospiraceae bacterium]MCF8356050.1 hypothetical protein [Melioribacteraceae bacterium]MCF8395515.1 hypothetical protein [Melioribacteraceae bacterium]